MNRRLRVTRYFCIVLAALLIFSFTVVGHAETQNSSQKVTLTLQDCIDKALQNDKSISRMDKTISKMETNHSDVSELKDNAPLLMSELSRYQSLAGREEYLNTYKASLESQLGSSDPDVEAALQIELGRVTNDLQELATYKTMFAPVLGQLSPTLITTDEQKFEYFIKNPYAASNDLWAGIKNYMTIKEATKISIQNGVRQMYDGLLEMYDALKLLEESYEIQKKQYDLTERMFENGFIPEVDKYTAEIGLKKLESNKNTLLRTIDNNEMRLKKQIGINLTQKIELVPYIDENSVRSFSTYEEYLKNALEKRAEITYAKFELDAKREQRDFTEKYITGNGQLITYSSRHWVEARLAVDEKDFAMQNATKDVTQDITLQYNSLEEKKRNIDLLRDKEKNIVKQYKELQTKLDQGVISESALWGVQTALISAKNDYRKALRDYDYALYKIELSSGTGFQYLAKAGVR